MVLQVVVCRMSCDIVANLQYAAGNDEQQRVDPRSDLREGQNVYPTMFKISSAVPMA